MLSNRVHAGAMNNDDFKLLAAKQIKKLKIIHSTVNVPRNIVSIRSDLDPTLTNKIKKTLIQMDKSANGQNILQQFKKTAKFDEFPNGVNTMLNSLNKLYTSLQKNDQE